MNCKKAQKYIPDLHSGNITPQLRAALERHLNECPDCRQWRETWSSIRHLSREVIKPPPEMDWSPFDLALDQELKRNPVPGRHRSGLMDSIQRVRGNIWYSWKILRPRWILVGATAVLLIFIGSHLNPIQSIEESHLTIGAYLTSQQQGGLVLYQEGEANSTYYSETINLELIEGKKEYSF